VVLQGFSAGPSRSNAPALGVVILAQAAAADTGEDRDVPGLALVVPILYHTHKTQITSKLSNLLTLFMNLSQW
jgi:hypothetical protein